MGRGKASEHQIQAAIFEWVRVKERSDERYLMVYAVPNGGVRHIGQAVKLKREGVRAGIFDICVDVAARGYHGMRIEVKTEEGRLTPGQRERSALYERHGYLPVIVRSLHQFISVVEAYFAGQEKRSKN